MQGTMQKQKCGYNWMRIGYADSRFTTVILLVSLSVMIYLSTWVYREIPNTKWQWVLLLIIYLAAAILYTNLGVWAHEQLHCLAFRGTTPKHRTQIVFGRKYGLFLNGHYRVRGAIEYQVMRRALLAPLILSVGLSVVGWLGSFVLPGWWLPMLLTLAMAGVIDMTHDFYMVVRIRVIGDKGKYWDNGKELEVVWKA
jgi:hypothetical protein